MRRCSISNRSSSNPSAFAARVAAATGVYVHASLYERADAGGVHNTAIAISPEGELVAFAPGNEAVEFTALADAEFMVGSAVPHPYDLVLGYYSVHTSPEALAKGEANIAAIEKRLAQEGRL